MAGLDVLAPLFENEEISDFIINNDLSVIPKRKEWAQGVDLLVLRIGDRTSKGTIQCFAMKGENLHVLYYDETKKAGKRIKTECLVEIEPEPSRLRRWFGDTMKKFTG